MNRSLPSNTTRDKESQSDRLTKAWYKIKPTLIMNNDFREKVFALYQDVLDCGAEVALKKGNVRKLALNVFTEGDETKNNSQTVSAAVTSDNGKNRNKKQLLVVVRVNFSRILLRSFLTWRPTKKSTDTTDNRLQSIFLRSIVSVISFLMKNNNSTDKF